MPSAVRALHWRQVGYGINFHTLGVSTQSGLCPLFLFLGPARMDTTISPRFGNLPRRWRKRGNGDYRYRAQARRQLAAVGCCALYLDKEGGPNMDELSQVSRELSELLDVHDIVDGAYTLEVSSPGINRPLKRPEHFHRFVGKKSSRAHARYDPGPAVVSRAAVGSFRRQDFNESRWRALRNSVFNDRKIELRARLECRICSKI